MKIQIKINLFLFLSFIFWAFIYPNHILFTEQLSLFLYSSDYWGQYAVQPGGWAAYCGNFLAQFYINRWAGAFIQTFFVAVLLALSSLILKKAGAKSGIRWVAMLPALLLTALQCDNYFTPGDSLSLICPFALTLLYMSIKQSLARRLAFTLAIVPVYLFSGAAATCCLYVACMLYELLYVKDAWKYSTPAWIVAAVLLPYAWQSVYLTPNEKLFDILTYPLVDGIQYVPHLLLAFTPFCILTYGILYRKRLTVGISGSFFFILALTGCGYYLFSKVYDRLEEQKFGMNLAAFQNEWDQVLKISERVKKPDQYTAYYTNLALAMKGELPDKMFRYSQTDENGLFLIRKWDDFNSRYGSDFYYHTGIINEAIRWIYDAHIVRRQGMDYHTLTRLAVWNKEGGYEPVAGKYFDILEGTLMYRSWSKWKRNASVPQREKSTIIPEEFYIGGREIIADMAWHYDNYPDNRMMLDYLLCYLLLKNELEKFLNLFNTGYQPSSDELPRAYQEALLFIAGMGKTDIQDYPIPLTVMQRYQAFNSMATKGDEAGLKKKFGDTWWYYSWKKK